MKEIVGVLEKYKNIDFVKNEFNLANDKSIDNEFCVTLEDIKHRKNCIFFSTKLRILTASYRYDDDIDWKKRYVFANKIKEEVIKNLSSKGLKRHDSLHEFNEKDINNFINTNLFDVDIDDYSEVWLTYVYITKQN
jgi:hypothetical protein